VSAPDTIREPTCARCGGRVDPSTNQCVACGAELVAPVSEPPAATRKPVAPSTVTTPSQRRAIYAIVVVSLLFAAVAALAAYCGRNAPEAPPLKHEKSHPAPK